MGKSDSHSDSVLYRPNYLQWFWIIFLILLLSGVSLRSWQNYQRRLALQNSRDQLDQIRQSFRRIRKLNDDHRGANSLTLAEVERELNDGKPLTLKFDGRRHVANWTCPQSKLKYRLYFRDGLWAGHSSNGPIPPKPTISTFDKSTEAIRRHIIDMYYVGPLAWFVLMVLCFFLPRHLILLSHLILAVALVCFAACLVAPNCDLTLQGIRSNDMIVSGMILLGLSVTVMLWFYNEKRRRLRAGIFCPNCEYNLKANVTGFCPECGLGISPNLQMQIKAEIDMTNASVK